MSPSRVFDRFMVGLEAGRDLKLRRLTDSEWRCFIGGVLPIAAKSPLRGALIIGQRRAEAEDIAAQAGTRVAAAESLLRKLYDWGWLDTDGQGVPSITRKGRLAITEIAAIRGVTNRSPISRRLREVVLQRDASSCRQCGSTEYLEIDHRIPWSIGGSDNIDNLQVLCRPCNRAKAAR